MEELQEPSGGLASGGLAPSRIKIPDPYYEQVSTRLRFVCSYPKSGNTWVRLFVAAYAMNGGSDLFDFVQQDDIQPFCFQAVSPIPISELGVGAEMQLRPAALLVLARFLRGPTLVKSHHACVEVNGLPLWTSQFTSKVICVVRDPRAVCPSLADHMGQTCEEAVRFMRNPQAIIGGEKKMHHILTTWSDHALSWLRSDLDVHMTSYERLHEDPVGEFTSILEHLEVPKIDPERVKAAVEFTRFDRMRDLEERHGFGEKSSKQERFFRRGRVDAWREDLDGSLARQIEEDHGEIMERFGYL